MFVATRGSSWDGHAFIPTAIERGAAVIVAERAPDPETDSGFRGTWVQVTSGLIALAWLAATWFGHPGRNLEVLATTGTNGKTTTTFLLRAILEAWGKKVGLLSTVEIRIGEERAPTIFTTPPAPEFDYLAFDFDRDPARLAASAEITASNSTDYRAFRARGAKAIVYMGVGDALLNANGVRRWYERLAEANGGLESTQRFARYFHVPGMGHCGGGPALDQFDPFGALVAWVEKGEAPDRMPATGSAFPGRSRPLCAYPQQTRYRGTGSSDDAANFRCE